MLVIGRFGSSSSSPGAKGLIRSGMAMKLRKQPQRFRPIQTCGSYRPGPPGKRAVPRIPLMSARLLQMLGCPWVQIVVVVPIVDSE